jgi:hypothetical protein
MSFTAASERAPDFRGLVRPHFPHSLRASPVRKRGDGPAFVRTLCRSNLVIVLEEIAAAIPVQSSPAQSDLR